MDVARTWPEKEKPLREGDSIEGEYVEQLTDIGSHKSNVYVLNINGERVGVWGSTVIDARMENVQIGMIVGFEYLGMERSKNGSEYKNFMVAVAEPDSGEQVDEDPSTDPL